jgi:hypothetical protein
MITVDKWYGHKQMQWVTQLIHVPTAPKKRCHENCPGALQWSTGYRLPGNWLWMILFRGQSMRPYNIGNEESFAILEIAQTVAKVINDQLAIKINIPANPYKSVERHIPSTQRAWNDLKLQSIIHLKETILRIVNRQK